MLKPIAACLLLQCLSNLLSHLGSGSDKEGAPFFSVPPGRIHLKCHLLRDGGALTGETQKSEGSLFFFSVARLKKIFQKSERGFTLTAGLLLEVSRMEKKELFQKFL